MCMAASPVSKTDSDSVPVLSSGFLKSVSFGKHNVTLQSWLFFGRADFWNFEWFEHSQYYIIILCRLYFMQHMICHKSISVGNNVRKHVELYSNSPGKIHFKDRIISVGSDSIFVGQKSSLWRHLFDFYKRYWTSVSVSFFKLGLVNVNSCIFCA